MSTTPLTQLEDRLRRAARGLDYPRTPDLGRAVRLRLARPRLNGVRLRVRAAVVLLVLLGAALAVPQVRAKLIEFFQIGVIRVLPAAPTGTSGAPSGAQIPMTATPRPRVDSQAEPDHIVSIAGLAGETTLEAAQDQVPFSIRLPEYPVDLGAPERVFLQPDGPMLILAWLDPDDPEKVRMSLHQIGPDGVYATKYRPRMIVETQVDGDYALWAQGPYLIRLSNGREEFRRLVNGDTLIWEADGITYRLETSLPLAEAIKIAESLK
jgi:hypothetical protein